METNYLSVVKTEHGYVVAIIHGSHLLRASRYFQYLDDADDCLFYYTGSYFRAKALDFDDILTEYTTQEKLL